MLARCARPTAAAIWCCILLDFRDRHLRAQQAREGCALDVFHRDEIEPLIVIDLVNGDDVRVVERRGGLGFAEESFFPRRGVAARIRLEDFERDVAIECRVARQPHFTHAAAAERALDELLAQRRADHWQFIGDLIVSLSHAP